MSDTAAVRAHEPERTVPATPPISPEEIRAQLRTILERPAFHRSKRCQRFLEYVCDKSLAGEAGTLKERTVATEVFGRRPQSDLGEDTIVRVGAREVRKRLAQYYVSPEGATARIRIELPLGSYAPEFRLTETLKVVRERLDPIAAPPLSGTPGLATRRRNTILFVGGVALVAVVAAVSVALLSGSAPATKAFIQFWSPVLDSPESLLIAVGHPLVYHPSTRAQILNEERLPTVPYPMQRPLDVPPALLTGADMIPVPNQYVGFGDMVAATEVAAMLARRKKDVRLRLASSLQFADLRDVHTLLIGAVTNRWTMELGRNWRFQFGRTAERKNAIIDTQVAPGSVSARRYWSLPVRDDGLAEEDYILVSRIRNSPTGGLIVVGAGIKQFGTEAAGRLLTSPEQLAGILRRLPVNWSDKNVQVVLHATVIGNTPAQPDVVAWHVW